MKAIVEMKVIIEDKTHTHTHRLLSASCPVLTTLGRYYKFECTVGMNGHVWVICTALAHTIVIINAIKNSQYMTEDQCTKMIERMLEQVH